MDVLNAEKTVFTQQSAAGDKVLMLTQEKKMALCETCGSFLVANDAAERTQSHVTGKQHIGYGMVRDFISEVKVNFLDEYICYRPTFNFPLKLIYNVFVLQATREAGRLAREKEAEERRKQREKEYENRERDRERDRHGERGRERERERERSREWSGRGSREGGRGSDWRQNQYRNGRDSERDRFRDRNGDASRDRTRGRSRSRSPIRHGHRSSRSPVRPY